MTTQLDAEGEGATPAVSRPHSPALPSEGQARPPALDLFCGAGGASMGLARAGFDVTGVDIRPQPRYPFRFVQADALKVPLDPREFAFIWASPVCQKYSRATLSQRIDGRQYLDLIPDVRRVLMASGRPYCIENVSEAPLLNAVLLCGSMFGLRTWRHRLIELSLHFRHLPLLPPCNHEGIGIPVVGHGTPSWVREKNGGRSFGIAEMRAALGIDWMNRDELSQAIPPAYAEFVGRQVISRLSARKEEGAGEGNVVSVSPHSAEEEMIIDTTTK